MCALRPWACWRRAIHPSHARSDACHERRAGQGGRAAAIEILLGSARVKELIKKGEVDNLKDAMITGATEGMQTFDEALFKLLKEGMISEPEALTNADAPTDLKLKIKLSGGAEGFSSENNTLGFAPVAN